MANNKINLHDQGAARIIDANLNRLKEGLRVCEEIARFILNHRQLTFEFKSLRHKVDSAAGKLFSRTGLLLKRQSLNDVGSGGNSAGELRRGDISDVFCANIQRAKESARVLEEFSKLLNIKAALSFKQLRYEIYEIEKKSFKKISALVNCRESLKSKHD